MKPPPSCVIAKACAAPRSRKASRRPPKSGRRNSRFLPSPLVGQGGAKRRMRGLYPRRQTPHPSSLREVTLSHRGRGEERDVSPRNTPETRFPASRMNEWQGCSDEGAGTKQRPRATQLENTMLRKIT